MRRIIGLFCLFLFSAQLSAQTLNPKRLRYIEQFKYWAMDEQIRTGVPASISLAQGILETAAGTSALCKEANNHFGIKCKKEWEGETYLHDDDRRHECFRKYKSAKQSYVDHSDFLKTRSHYAFLFDLDVNDYKAWCNGLRKAGYATNPQYANRLIQIIDEYSLQQYTTEAIEIARENEVEKEVVPIVDKKVEEPVIKKEKIEVVEKKEIKKVVPQKRKIKRIYDKLMVKNGRQGFWARKGDYLLPEAVQYNIRYAKLLSINDLADEPLYDDMFIYLKRKSKKGDRLFHRVKEGETMHSISQNAGVILKYLYVYNNLYESEEPAVGEKIYLQGRTTRTPKIVAVAKDKPVVKSVKNEVVVKKEKPKEETVVIKKTAEVEKIDLNVKKEETVKKNTKDAIVGAQKAQELKQDAKKKEATQAKVETKKKETIKKKEVVKKAIVKEVKKAAPAKSTEEKKVAVKTNVKAEKSNSPIIDLNKARRVEQLLNDGTREVDKLVVRDTVLVDLNKVRPEPGTNNKQLIIQKAAKNKAKQEKAKRQYNEKGVSDDVKNLKKKFDSLIYDDK